MKRFSIKISARGEVKKYTEAFFTQNHCLNTNTNKNDTANHERQRFSKSSLSLPWNFVFDEFQETASKSNAIKMKMKK